MNPKFWGKAGAGILFTCEEDNTIFLMHRSRYVEQPGTWGIPGGSVSGEGMFDSEIGAERPTDEVFWAGAQQETIEECGDLPDNIEVVDTIDFVSGSFVYRNFICNISLASKLAWTPTIELNWENDGFDWFDFGDFPSGTHFGVDYILEKGFSLPRRSNPGVSIACRKYASEIFRQLYRARLMYPNVLSHIETIMEPFYFAHFTDNEIDIMEEGFLGRTDELFDTKRTYGEIVREGHIFAFRLDATSLREGLQELQDMFDAAEDESQHIFEWTPIGMYGSGLVISKAEMGVEMYHPGDQEMQMIIPITCIDENEMLVVSDFFEQYGLEEW
jgi:8-oxo-dGTP pyrophosphatase MutT (NUDIX family)